MSTIVLLDVDGTITDPMGKVPGDVLSRLKDLSKICDIGIVDGSNYEKTAKQIGKAGLKIPKFIFSENGTVVREHGKVVDTTLITDRISELVVNQLIDFSLKYISNLELPAKKGTFIEYRNGTINISPLGRNSTPQERDKFHIFDKKNGVRQEMIEAIKSACPSVDKEMQFSIREQISFDAFPRGFDKTFCLRYLNSYTRIYFIGDSTSEDGDDYELSINPRTTSYTTSGPLQTMKLLKTIENNVMFQF